MAYTDHLPDERIDAHAVDYTDASLGFFGCTYHYLIKPSGVIEIGRDPRTHTSRGSPAHCALNILIGVVGGRNEEGERVSTITSAQREAAEELMQALANVLQVPLELTDAVENRALRELRLKEERAEIKMEERLDQLEALTAH